MRQSLIASLAQYGLIIHGEITPQDDAVWPIIDGAPASAVALIGHGGSSFWPQFSHWVSQQNEAIADPLDTWSKDVLRDIANAHNAKAYFPSDKPYMPFQRWAMLGLGIRPSPLGILMHPKFGLWHGFRGALAFREWTFEATPITAHPCDTCEDKPCLQACPVNAFSPEGLDRPACYSHLNSVEGIDCMSEGCAARNVCPIGAHYRYDPAQIRFHMNAYKGSSIS